MLERKKIAMIVAEFLGTAILTAVVLAVSKSAVGLPYFVAIAAGVTVGFMPLIIGVMSGGHVNPAVTLGFWTLRKITTVDTLVYIAAQFLGAVVALRLYVYLVDQAVKNIAGKTFDWRVLVAEAVGTFVFTFGIAAAVYQGYRGLRSAVTIGTSLFLGVLIASIVSNGLLNPALALGVQSWDKAYVIGPIIGSVVGMNLYAMLFEGPAVKLWSTASPTSSSSARQVRSTAKSHSARRK